MKLDYDVLIIEDEQVVINSAKRILGSLGLKLDSCADAAEGLAKIQETRYGVVISDVMLPGLSGMQFLQEAKKQDPFLKVIIISGYATRDFFLQALALGAFDFIPKPFEFEELLGTVYRCLRYKKQNVPVKGAEKSVPCEPYRRYHLGDYIWTCIAREEVQIGLGNTFTVIQSEIKQIEFAIKDHLLHQGDLLIKIIDNNDHIHRVCSPLSGRFLSQNGQIDKQNFADIDLADQWLAQINPSDLDSELQDLRRF